MNRSRCLLAPALALLFILLLLPACAHKISHPDQDALEMSISAAVDIAPATAQDYTFRLIVTGQGIIDPLVFPLRYENYRLYGTVVVPAGPQRRFRIEARDEAGALMYAGEAVADVYPGSTVSLQLVLIPQVPMLKFSPRYITRPMGTVLAVTIEVFNIPRLHEINFNILSRNQFEQRLYHRDYEVNPRLAEFTEFYLGQGDFADYVRLRHLGEAQSFVDAKGYAEIATIYYETYLMDADLAECTIVPEITSMLDAGGNQIPPEGVFTAGSLAELYHYTSRYIAHWHMGPSDGPDSLVYDRSQNKLHGTARGTSFDYCYYNQLCRYFNGDGDFIEVPDNDLRLLDIDGPFTVSLWFRPREAEYLERGSGRLAAPGALPTSSLFCKGNASGAINYQLLIDDPSGEDGHFSIIFRYGSSTLHEYRVDVPDVYREYNWLHMVFSHRFGEPASALMAVGAYGEYYFPLQKFEGQWVRGTGRAAPPLTNTPLLIGRDNSDGGNYFWGSLDEIELLDEALTIEEILFNFGPPR